MTFALQDLNLWDYIIGSTRNHQNSKKYQMTIKKKTHLSIIGKDLGL